MSKLTFKEKETLRIATINPELYKKLKTLLESRDPDSYLTDSELIWDPHYETFLIERI